MPKSSSLADKPILRDADRLGTALTRLLSVYLVPIAVALVSLLALIDWNSHYAARGDRGLPMQVATESGAPLEPGAALQLLDRRSTVERYETHLSEAPVWFQVRPLGEAGGNDAIEFPSRHAIDISCWDADTLTLLGAASHDRSLGAMAAAKAGFVLRPQQMPARLLCRSRFTGPARLNVVQWPANEMTASIRQFHRKSGLLDGGMIVLSLFIVITAAINRQLLYLEFAAWLILNLRLGAISAGWDIQWLGQELPQAWLVPSRAVTTALYAISTVTLYMTLFGAELMRSRFAHPLRIMQWLSLTLLPMALLLPFRIYLPTMWCLAGPGLVLMTFGLASVMKLVQARVAMWFAASFGVTFLSTLAEVVSAALGMRQMLGLVNSVTAALASSLLAALAVAEQMRIETEKRIAAQAELEHAYEAMPVGLFTLDQYGGFLSANPALLRMLECAALAPGRTRWQQFFSDATWSLILEQVDSPSGVELEIDPREGERRFLVRATLAHGRIEGVLEDITEKTKATEQLRFMANNDPLTKVFNRRGIEKMFEAAAATAAPGRPLTLAYLDLDRFKLINDMFGHAAGDEVLKQVCERITLTLAGGQQIGRVGGDEFVIVMPDTAISLASLICNSIVERIGGSPYRVGDKAFHVRGSVGLIEVVPGLAMKDAVATADRACREAKNSNKASLVVYERGSRAFHEREAELNLMARLSGPNATDGMFLEMQPIMSLRSPHESLDFEVLLRMREADGRVSPAGPLVAAAEKSGRMGMIDRWVMSNTLEWIERHLDSLTNTRFVCMNLSGASLNDERFVQDTLDILARHEHVASRLCMEITESVALHDLDNTRRFIDQVRSFGVKVALDDFGAGYTSFSYLKELPADVLKIDGNFIVNINAHPANVAIVEAIVNLAVNLGMKTIAEWAEDAETVRTLAEIGVDYVQGYAIARSQPPEKVLAASSSASFIKGEEVLRLVRTLGAPANEPALAGVASLRDLH